MHLKFLPLIALTAVLTLVSACSSDSSDDDTFAAGTPCGFVETIAPAAIVSGALAQTDCTADQTFPDQSQEEVMKVNKIADAAEVAQSTPTPPAISKSSGRSGKSGRKSRSRSRSSSKERLLLNLAEADTAPRTPLEEDEVSGETKFEIFMKTLHTNIL